ncbi:MAG TPA: radical SAM protein [Sedimentisphaerales bacterium]|nr:radical SAM protein [Sedimentisphaerales bacterium]
MLTLINTNRMTPPIGPLGLEYVAGAARAAGIKVDVVDLCLADDPAAALKNYFASSQPRLVGLSFRNVDDCFWPRADWFLPKLAETVRELRSMTDAPIVLGGVGFSIFPERIVEYVGADFGIRGDGEQATVALLDELKGTRSFDRVGGLIRREDGRIVANRPLWPAPLSLPTKRDAIDNLAYFKAGGQCGLETKRGCNRRCIYCADPLSKGATIRPRDPAEVADEAEALLSQGIDVLHLCDSEFNVPDSHALAVCEEFIRRALGRRIRWYTYMAVVPFDAELAGAMAGAGCVGIDFTGDTACPSMLKAYRQMHVKEDLASAVRLCRDNGIAAMIDLLLGGPGETPETVAETIEFIRQIAPDCAGAPVGVRVYPCTEMARIVEAEGPPEDNPNIHRKYDGPVDLLKPTFYISRTLGPNPARLVNDLIAGDARFFGPLEEADAAEQAVPTDHNYNENVALAEAIRQGARGAYWNILRNLRDK